VVSVVLVIMGNSDKEILDSGSKISDVSNSVIMPILLGLDDTNTTLVGNCENPCSLNHDKSPLLEAYDIESPFQKHGVEFSIQKTIIGKSKCTTCEVLSNDENPQCPVVEMVTLKPTIDAPLCCKGCLSC